VLALKTSEGDLDSMYTVRKHNLETNYIPFLCPIMSTETRWKSLEGRRTVESEINIVDINSNSAPDADFAIC